MEMQSTPAAVETAPNIWQTIVGVFTSPSQAFEGFKKKPTLLVLLILTFLISYFMSVPIAKYNAMVQYDLVKTSEIIPPAQLEEIRTKAENANPWLSSIGTPFVIVVVGLVTALLAMFFGRVIFGGSAGYKEIWGVVLLTGLITILGGLLRIPLVLAKGTMLVSYGLAAFFPGKNFSSILYSLFFYCDIFFVWSVIAGGIGYSKIFGISRGKGIFTAFISSFIMVLLLVSLTAFGISIAGVEVSFF